MDEEQQNYDDEALSVVEEVEENVSDVDDVNVVLNVNAPPRQNRRERLQEIFATTDIRAKQTFFITLRNQLIPARGDGRLLADPNSFLYGYEKTHLLKNGGRMEYFKCDNKACHGRCKVKNSTQLTITKAHNKKCKPDAAEIELRRFKSDLKSVSKSDILTRYSDIYRELAPRYPLATDLMRPEDFSHQMYVARRSVTSLRLPTTLQELGEYMENVDYRRTFAFDLGNPPQLFFDGIYETADGRSYAAFRSATVVNAATGGHITIEIDGTFSIVPSRDQSATKKFGDCHQLLMIHYRHRNRNYPIGYFLLSSALTDTLATEILQRVVDWLGPTTVINEVLSDYELAIRNACRTVVPNAKRIGCQVHYARAVCNWAYKKGAYSKQASPADIIAVRRSMALCFLPDENYIRMGIDVIEADLGTSAFGSEFIQYLRSTWLGQNISVWGRRTRTTNGSESFHWRVQRVHDRMNNNINQFLEQLRKIELMCALSIRQFHNCMPSKKQLGVERMHRDIENAFDLDCGRQPDAARIRSFLDNTLHFTDNIHKHFIKRRANKAKEASGYSLYVADKEEKGCYTDKRRKKSNFNVTLTLKPLLEKHKIRTLILKVNQPIGVQQQHSKFQVHTTNLVIADESVSIPHATIALNNEGRVEIRDEGSATGTYINERRLSYQGITSPTFILRSGDNIVFGDVAYTTQITVTKAQSLLSATVPPETTHITLQNISGDDVPERNLCLEKDISTTIGRSTKLNKPLRSNALYKLRHMGYKHASIVWTGAAFFLQATSATYRTWVDGKIVLQNEQIQLRHRQEIVFGANEINDNLKVMFIIDDLPLNTLWRDIELTFFVTSAKQGEIQKFIMKDNNILQIGRRAPTYQCQPHEFYFRNEIVSRDHAVISYENGALLIRDNNSENGTYVNGNLLPVNKSVILENGCEIQLGAAKENEGVAVLLKLCFEVNIEEPEPHTSKRIELNQPTTYVTLTSKSKALLSSFHQGTIADCQNETYLNKQWLTMAVAAIVKSFDVPMPQWNTTILDDIIFNGDDLYADIVQHMTHDDRTPPPNGSLHLNDLTYVQNNLPLFGHRYSLTYADESIIDGNLHLSSTEELPLQPGLIEFFQHHTAGLLSVSHQIFAVIKHNNEFYIFHPSTNFYSKSKATLFQCLDLTEFYKTVRQIVGCKNEWYSIQCIHVHNEPVHETQKAPCEQESENQFENADDGWEYFSTKDNVKELSLSSESEEHSNKYLSFSSESDDSDDVAFQEKTTFAHSKFSSESEHSNNDLSFISDSEEHSNEDLSFSSESEEHSNKYLTFNSESDDSDDVAFQEKTTFAHSKFSSESEHSNNDLSFSSDSEEHSNNKLLFSSESDNSDVVPFEKTSRLSAATICNPHAATPISATTTVEDFTFSDESDDSDDENLLEESANASDFKDFYLNTQPGPSGLCRRPQTPRFQTSYSDSEDSD